MRSSEKLAAIVAHCDASGIGDDIAYLRLSGSPSVLISPGRLTSFAAWVRSLTDCAVYTCIAGDGFVAAGCLGSVGLGVLVRVDVHPEILTAAKLDGRVSDEQLAKLAAGQVVAA